MSCRKCKRSAIPLFAESMSVTVSYTHLDVYKRQGATFGKAASIFWRTSTIGMRQLLIREHTLRMHHVEDDDRVAAQLDEYHVRELVNDQFARSGNPVAFADTLGVRGKRFDLPDLSLIHI